ncbi:MAG: AAC(6')-Ia family aminoglycoside 6'-N-acetyltransferase [Saccharospirillum sp.]|uniref:AAC(6')-Ia family aminoglycoside 6'-N-acetyltransferase n=1 Tax=Saccharospirillum sp. TaxID=2033801 RepID=UPI00329869EF
MKCIELSEKPALHEVAATVLMEAFLAKGNNAWPTLERARKTVDECIAVPNVCVGVLSNGTLAGWGGLRPMYDKTWELHPLVVAPAFQGLGVGRELMLALEQRARAIGLVGIVLGSDDEFFETSLSHVDIHGGNALVELQQLTNVNHHPFEFYQKCGYSVVGLIPNANGKNKPDIWMWKDLTAE